MPTPSPNTRRARGDWPRAARWSRRARREFDFHLVDKIDVWSDDAARIYAAGGRARSGIRRPPIPWNAPFDLPTMSKTPSCRS